MLPKDEASLEALQRLGRRSSTFRRYAHELLAQHEGAKSRVISVDQTVRRLHGLSLKQEGLYQEALGCVERGLYRAAHVMAWAAFVDFLEAKLGSDGLKQVMLIRPSWSKYKAIEELREAVPEDQLIDAARELGLLGKQETKAVKGLLARRNECAHPTSYQPGLNEALGFVSELVNRMSDIQPRNV